MKFKRRVSVFTLFVTEIIARMYGEQPVNGVTPLERVTRRVVQWILGTLSALVRMSPVFSRRFSDPVSTSLHEMSVQLKG